MSDEERVAQQRSTEDLAQALGVPADRVTLVRIEAVDWADTSLGCPKPGEMYAQVITPGYRIILASQGRVYEYHADRTGHVVRC